MSATCSKTLGGGGFAATNISASGFVLVRTRLLTLKQEMEVGVKKVLAIFPVVAGSFAGTKGRSSLAVRMR